YGHKLLKHLNDRGDFAAALRRGEHVELSDGAGASRSPLFVFPLNTGSCLVALLAVVFPPRSRPSHKALVRLHRLCEAATPLLAARGGPNRICEIEKTLPELTQANEQLEGLAQINSHVMRNAVHDLRTPLVAIRGYAR